MKKMIIYEPAMCCSTGLCGVGVDSELLRISTVINTLKKNNVEVERFNLTNSPQAFIENKEVNTCINEKGVDELPITVLDGEIVITGRYPTNEEFVKLLNVLKSFIGAQPKIFKITTKKSGGCDCKGGCC